MFTIRIHSPDDIANLQALDKRVRPYRPEDKDEVETMYMRAKAAGAASDPRWMAQGETVRLDTPAQFPAFWVAIDGGETLIGSVAVDQFRSGITMPAALPISHSWARDGDVAELLRLRVDPDVQGMGLGEALCVTAIAWAKEQGFQRMVVNTTTPQLPARQLFAKIGFMEVETTFIGQYELIWSEKVL